jgi:hypothetical protein
MSLLRPLAICLTSPCVPCTCSSPPASSVVRVLRQFFLLSPLSLSLFCSRVTLPDTRTTRIMLKRYKILGEQSERKEGRVELMSYHQHSSPSKVNTIIQVGCSPPSFCYVLAAVLILRSSHQILKTGTHVVSLVSDAGR